LSDPERGWVAVEVAEELPRLALLEQTLPGGAGASSPAVRERLRELSDRVRGAGAVALRRSAVPAAYRAFYRQVGLDPDLEPPPAEAAVLGRLLAGGFRSAGAIEDARTIAVVETSVPVWALDDASLDGPLGIRAAAPAETLGRGAREVPLPAGRLVVADARRPVAVLFGEPAEHLLPGRRTERLRAFTVLVAGVPDIHAEEALWIFAEALGS